MTSHVATVLLTTTIALGVAAPAGSEGVDTPRALVDAACRLAGAHLRLGRPSDGLALLDRVAPLLAGAEGDPGARATLSLTRGTLEHYRASLAGQPQERAIVLLGEAVAAAREAGDETLLAGAADRLGLAVYSQGFYGGRHDAALPHLELALELRRRAGDARGVAETLFHLGLVYENRTGATAADAERALALYREALPLARDGGFAVEESFIVRHLAGIDHERGDLDAALRGFERSLELRRSAGFELYLAPALLAVGDVLAARGDRPGAARRYEEALARAQAIGAVRFAVSAHLALGDLARQGGDTGTARRSYPAARKLAHDAAYEAGVARASERLRG